MSLYGFVSIKYLIYFDERSGPSKDRGAEEAIGINSLEDVQPWWNLSDTHDMPTSWFLTRKIRS